MKAILRIATLILVISFLAACAKPTAAPTAAPVTTGEVATEAPTEAPLTPQQ